MTKQGRFTLQEQAWLRNKIADLANPRDLDFHSIAAEMDRDFISVRGFIKREGLIRTDTAGKHVKAPTLDSGPASQPLKQLRSENFYKSVKKQLSEDELQVFNSTWIQTINQFDMDIRMTEKLQLKQLLLLDIFMDRVNIEKKTMMSRIEEVSALLTKELAMSRAKRDNSQIQRLENELSFLRLATKETAKEFKDYLTEFKNIQKQLDGARSERRKKVDDSKTNFAGWIRLIQDRTIRESVGRQMEVFNLAKDKAKNKLYEYHEYEDHKVDTPILNEDSVKDE